MLFRSPKPSVQGNLKIQLIQKALNKLKPEVVLVGPNEWQNGLHMLDSNIPYILSNQGPKLSFLTSKKISQKNGQDTIVSGYLSPELTYFNKNEKPKIYPVNQKLISDWEIQFKKNENAFRILIFRGNEKELKEFEDSGLFDFIIVGSNNDDELKQTNLMQTNTSKFLMIPTKGQGILTAELSDLRSLTIKNYESYSKLLSLTWLKSNFKDAPELDETFRNYNAAVKEMFFKNLERKKKQESQSPFVGVQVCISCHTDTVINWKERRHAHAFATLEKIGKHFDPECLTCHVVGLKPWQNNDDTSSINKKLEGKTGFLSMQTTPHLKNVQCENCHGPARLHIENSNIKPANKDPKRVCVSCHHGSHSPLFNYETYWSKIKHGFSN